MNPLPFVVFDPRIRYLPIAMVNADSIVIAVYKRYIFHLKPGSDDVQSAMCSVIDKHAVFHQERRLVKIDGTPDIPSFLQRFRQFSENNMLENRFVFRPQDDDSLSLAINRFDGYGRGFRSYELGGGIGKYLRVLAYDNGRIRTAIHLVSLWDDQVFRYLPDAGFDDNAFLLLIDFQECEVAEIRFLPDKILLDKIFIIVGPWICLDAFHVFQSRDLVVQSDITPFGFRPLRVGRQADRYLFK